MTGTRLFFSLFSHMPGLLSLSLFLPGIVREREKEKELSSCPFFLSGLPHYVQASRYAGKEKGLRNFFFLFFCARTDHRSPLCGMLMHGPGLTKEIKEKKKLLSHMCASSLGL